MSNTSHWPSGALFSLYIYHFSVSLLVKKMCQILHNMHSPLPYAMQNCVHNLFFALSMEIKCMLFVTYVFPFHKMKTFLSLKMKMLCASHI